MAFLFLCPKAIIILSILSKIYTYKRSGYALIRGEAMPPYGTFPQFGTSL
jgi:hypothetical protein